MDIPGPKVSTQQPQEINRRLDQIENEMSYFDMDLHRGSINLLIMMDEVARLISAEGWRPESLKAEQSQFEHIKAGLAKRAGKIVKAAGGSQSYQYERDKHQPPVENEWWYLDDFLRNNRKKWARKALPRLAGGLIICILLIIVYHRFLAPDPRLIAKFDHQNSAIDAMLGMQYQRGLNEANAALAYDPKDVESLELKGMALTMLGNSNEASLVYLKAQDAAGGEAKLYETRSLEWITVNEPSRALGDAQEAILLDQKSVEGYWYRGKAEVLLGKYQNAEDDFNQAISLANQENQLVIVVQIKGDLANLMQMLQ